MDTNGTTTATGTFTFEDRVIQITPLNLKIIGKMNNFFRGLLIAGARASFDEETTAQDRKDTLDTAVRQSMRVHFHSEAGQAVMSTLEGVCELVRVCGDLDRGTAFRLCKDEVAREAFLAEFKALNKIDKEAEETGKNLPEVAKPT